MDDKSLAVYEGGYYLAPAAPLPTVLQSYQLKKDIITSVLKTGVDYGKIPGAGDKPALLKPGAEKFANIFGLAPVFEDVEKVEDWTGADHGGEPFFYYRQKCKLYRGEHLAGSADGSCNSWEKKYRYRLAELTCPECGKPAIKKSKFPPRNQPNAKPGWYCHDKAGGCGANFAADDKRISEQERGQIRNPDVAEQVNTILKMAQKRALVAAVLITTGASDYFTQDVEDFITGDWHDEEPPAPPAAQSSPVSTPANGNGHKPAQEEEPPMPPDPMFEMASAAGEALTGEPLKRVEPWDPDAINDILKKYPMPLPRLSSTLKYCGLPRSTEYLREWFDEYKAARDAGMVPQEAGKLADAKLGVTGANA